MANIRKFKFPVSVTFRLESETNDYLNEHTHNKNQFIVDAINGLIEETREENQNIRRMRCSICRNFLKIDQGYFCDIDNKAIQNAEEGMNCGGDHFQLSKSKA